MASSVTGSLSTAIGAMAGGLVAHAFNGTVFPIAAGFVACSLIATLIVFAVEGKRSFFGRNRLA
jgi:DHA1 family bicyclomycin/chloramphenicol resistance-like MFS transporter